MQSQAKLQETKVRENKSTQIYEQSVILNFWGETDKNVIKLVKNAAEVESAKILSNGILKRLSRTEKAYLNGSSAEELDKLMQSSLTCATRGWQRFHMNQRKLERAERRTTRFMDSFSNYLEAYKGVIQIMNGAPGVGGYGDAAYGALFLFVVVAVNKAKTEALLDKMMHTLHQEYCRIKIVNKVHPTDRMKEHTAVVYRLGIEFLYMAVRYYYMSPFRRLWHIAARPPSVGLEDKISEIGAAIEEIRKEMEVLDSERLKHIEIKIEEQAEINHRMEKDVQALRGEANRRRLDHIKDMISINTDDIDPSIEQYDDLLSEIFETRRSVPFDVHEHLYRNEYFRKWHDGSHLNMLILQGYTDTETDLSWLSPSATHVVRNMDKIFRESPPLLLRHFCRTRDNCGNRKVSGKNIVKSLIFQLLRDDVGMSLLQDNSHYEHVKRSIDSVNTIDVERSIEIARTYFAILKDLVSIVNIQQVLIVLDRLDVVQGDIEAFVHSLVELVSGCHGKVKVMLTVCGVHAFDEYEMKRLLTGDGYRILRIDQGE